MPDETALIYYGTILGTLLAAGLGFPIPEEIPIVTAGALLGHKASDPNSTLRWFIMLPVCISGVVIGDTLLYSIGRFFGPWLLSKKWVQKRVLPPQKRARIEHNFKRYGIWILLVARLMPGIRSPIFIMAGMNRLPVTKFLIADGLYAIPGVSLLFFAGYWFTDQFVEIVKKVDSVRPIVVVLGLAVLAAAGAYYFLKHPVSEGDPKDVPFIGEQIVSHVPDPEENGKPVQDATSPGPTANTPPASTNSS
jgi:membrane protein DedA with SNARE-associated domain